MTCPNIHTVARSGTGNSAVLVTALGVGAEPPAGRRGRGLVLRRALRGRPVSGGRGARCRHGSYSPGIVGRGDSRQGVWVYRDTARTPLWTGHCAVGRREHEEMADPSGWSTHHAWPSQPRHVADAREFVSLGLSAHGLEGHIEVVRLVVSELATNAVRACRRPRLRFPSSRQNGSLTVRVTDASLQPLAWSGLLDVPEPQRSRSAHCGQLQLRLGRQPRASRQDGVGDLRLAVGRRVARPPPGLRHGSSPCNGHLAGRRPATARTPGRLASGRAGPRCRSVDEPDGQRVAVVVAGVGGYGGEDLQHRPARDVTDSWPGRASVAALPAAGSGV